MCILLCKVRFRKIPRFNTKYGCSNADFLVAEGASKTTSLAGHSDYLDWCQLVRAFEVEVTLPRTS